MCARVRVRGCVCRVCVVGEWACGMRVVWWAGLVAGVALADQVGQVEVCNGDVKGGFPQTWADFCNE